jgi:hypothetical protein
MILVVAAFFAYLYRAVAQTTRIRMPTGLAGASQQASGQHPVGLLKGRLTKLAKQVSIEAEQRHCLGSLGGCSFQLSPCSELSQALSCHTVALQGLQAVDMGTWWGVVTTAHWAC